MSDAQLPPRKSDGWSETTFLVIVTQQPAGSYHVHVSDQAGNEFASTTCSDLWTALEMTVPYMACAAEPDPFVGLAKRGRAMSPVETTATGRPQNDESPHARPEGRT